MRGMVDQSHQYESIFENLRAQVESLEQEKAVQAANYKKMKELSELAMQRLHESEQFSQDYHRQSRPEPLAKDERQDLFRQMDNLTHQLVEA